MAVRKPWASLSEAYKGRLARKGITPQMHAAGEAIRAARGHAKTPEHPSEGVRKPKEFPGYMKRRSQLVAEVRAKKYRLWGLEHKYNDRRANQIINKGFGGNNPPSMARLQWAIDASEDDMLRAMRSGDEEYSFLWYH
jgi:hypothetical protein